MDDNYWRYPFWITVEEKNNPALQVYFETFRSYTIIGHTPGETT